MPKQIQLDLEVAANKTAKESTAKKETLKTTKKLNVTMNDIQASIEDLKVEMQTTVTKSILQAMQEWQTQFSSQMICHIDETINKVCQWVM